ncbi:hypothetical protein E3T19_07250 [Cryobacterium sp. TMT4-31]|nr:hypothetical protein E3T19_07250 [Cryobacterium sp. TMT4-31]
MKLVLTSGRVVATVPRELGVHEATLGRWNFMARNETRQTEMTESQLAELMELRKETADLKLGRAIRKEAPILFAQEESDTNGKRSN